jgi:CO/xanthine dehydrogenase FAD-binding subunit
MTAAQSPKTITDLVKLIARYGKKAFLVSGVDPTGDRIAGGKVVIDVSNIGPLNEIETQRDRITIGTGLNLGRLAREATGENGLLRQTASLIASPLVRNRVIFLQSLDPESPYFDITTPLVLLESKVRLQSPSGKRTVSIRDYLENVTKGLKKGEIPILVEFSQMPPDERVAFFRVARAGGKGSVSAAARIKMVRGICKDPEVVVSSLSLIPLRSKAAEKHIDGQPGGEELIKRASQLAADEILELASSKNSYERSLVEIAVARTLRGIM